MGTSIADRGAAAGKSRKYESTVASYKLESQANGEEVLTPVFHPRTYMGAGARRAFVYLLVAGLLNFTIGMPIINKLGNVSVGLALLFGIPVAAFIFGLRTGKPAQERKQIKRNRITMDAEGFTIRGLSYRWEDVSHFYVKGPGTRYVEGASEFQLNLRLQNEAYKDEVRWMVFMQFGNDPAVALLFQLTRPQATEIVDLLESKKAEYLGKT